jgi:uncharacterized protein
MSSDKLRDQIESKARALHEHASDSHGWDHTARVTRLALHIARAEGADSLIVELAALLHDIGRHREDETQGEICHAEEGARMAGEILARHGVSETIAAPVLHCIRHHRFRKGAAPDTLEAKVLFDADKLDAIGAVGIGRAFLFAGEQGAKLHNAPGVDPLDHPEYSREDTAFREFLRKLRHVHERMLTHEGKRLAEERHTFMVAFFERLQREAEGEV